MGYRMTEDEIQQDAAIEGASRAPSGATSSHEEAVSVNAESSSNVAMPAQSPTGVSEGEDAEGEDAEGEDAEDWTDESSDEDDDLRAESYLPDERWLAEGQSIDQTGLENPWDNVKNPFWDPNGPFWRELALVATQFLGVPVDPELVFLRMMPYFLGERPLPRGLYVNPVTGHLTTIRPANTTTTPTQVEQQPDRHSSEPEAALSETEHAEAPEDAQGDHEGHSEDIENHNSS